MSLVVFAIGVLVFLITVFGTVVSGGLLLTDRQLEEQPELVPDDAVQHDGDDSGLDRVRSLVKLEY
jgi:hypothetical protein